MFVVTVSFTVRPEAFPAFLLAMKAQAATTLEREPDCVQFDVCRAEGDGKILLYEVYRNRAAFDAHLETAHYLAFDRAIRDLVEGKTVTTYTRYTI